MQTESEWEAMKIIERNPLREALIEAFPYDYFQNVVRKAYSQSFRTLSPVAADKLIDVCKRFVDECEAIILADRGEGKDSK